MAKQKKDALTRLLEYGVGPAYTLILTLTMGIFKWILIFVLFAIAWWEKIR